MLGVSSDREIERRDVRSRESNCYSPPSPWEIQNAACRHDQRRAKSVGDNITHRFTHPLAPSRSLFNSHRNTATPKPVSVAVLHLRHRKYGMPRVFIITDERAKPFGGNFTHPPAQPRSPFNSHRNATSPKRYKGNRANSAP
ncbi:hypothetical protein NP493_21g07002 [Ridgeia piscesae]|uniref:Uncharacterized protein n=1 Tax=Ridgeia piscesae TaxID=27915 RepID=A0AAD9PDS8_RIDPI|nr:hypothetical protein NP493_21g07002 [Ridgeia piscesae]